MVSHSLLLCLLRFVFTKCVGLERKGYRKCVCVDVLSPYDTQHARAVPGNPGPGYGEDHQFYITLMCVLTLVRYSPAGTPQHPQCMC